MRHVFLSLFIISTSLSGAAVADTAELLIAANSNKANIEPSLHQPSPEISDPKAPGFWDPQLQYGLSWSSDVVARGGSLTNGEPGAQGYFTVATGPFYAGVYRITQRYVAPGMDIDREDGVYLGARKTFGRYTIDAMANRVLPGPDSSLAFWEHTLSLSYAWSEKTTLRSQYYWTPDTGNSGHTFQSVQLGGSHFLTDKWSTFGTVGANFPERRDGHHVHWYDVGVTYQATNSLAVDLHYKDTDTQSEECFPKGTCGGKFYITFRLDMISAPFSD